MNIPYFYLEVGDLRIFQPQNKYKEKISYSPRVMVSSCPAVGGDRIYLNGRSLDRAFEMNRTYFDISSLINELKQIEVDDV